MYFRINDRYIENNDGYLFSKLYIFWYTRAYYDIALHNKGSYLRVSIDRANEGREPWGPQHF